MDRTYSMHGEINAFKILVKESEGDTGISKRTMLKFMLKKLDVRVWTELLWFIIGFSGRHL
jgi:hypothetical protein